MVIGIEVHAQLNTATKLFCSCPTRFGTDPNTNTCPVCSGQPGALPVLNREAARMAVMAGLAMHCTINRRSLFARKNYFYPDLPKGYQISQFEEPVCSGGYVEVEVEGAVKKVRLNRIHMEEDAGKLVHVGAPGIWGSKASAVDYNRSSVPLIEIVTEPDISSPAEAREFMVMLRAILVTLGICNGNMEEGNLRCDANVSVREKGDKALGVKVEIKNMNSLKAIERAPRLRDGAADTHEERRRDHHAGDAAVGRQLPEDRAHCGARRSRMITAISRTRTCSRWRSRTSGPRRCGSCFRPCRSRARSATKGNIPSPRRKRGSS